MKIKKSIFLILMSICIIGCGAINNEVIVQGPESKMHSHNNQNTKAALSIIGIKINPSLIEQEIGHLHHNLGTKPLTFYGANAVEAIKNSIDNLNRKLNESNYTVSTESTFVTNHKPDILIEGIVARLEYDVYAVTFFEKKSEASIEISWAVFDTKKKKVVYKKILPGMVKGPPAVGVNATTINGAVMDSFQKMLADTDFSASI